MADTERIVVGIDGSAEARHALAWAAKEAHLRGAVLQVVHAWDAPWHYWEAPVVPTSPEEIQESQEKLVAEEIKLACGDLDDLRFESEITNDLPARALIEKSKGADMVVVGSRGRGGFAGLLLGSVSQQVVDHAACPVVVVPYKGERAS